MKFLAYRLTLTLVFGFIAWCAFEPAMASEENGPVSMEVDKPLGGGLPVFDQVPQQAPQPTLAESITALIPTTADRPDPGPVDDWAWWTVFGVAVAGGTAGLSIESRRRPSNGLSRSSLGDRAPVAVNSDEPLSIHNSNLREYDPAQDGVASSTVSPSNDSAQNEEATTDLPEPEVDKLPNKMEVLIYPNRTWKLVDEEGNPIAFDYAWQHTTSGGEAFAKKKYQDALAGLFSYTVGLPISGYWALGFALGGGTVTDRATNWLPVPQAGQTDIILTRIISLQDEPHGEDIYGHTIYQRVLRYSTLHMVLGSDGHASLVHGWQDEEFIPNPNSDLSL